MMKGMLSGLGTYMSVVLADTPAALWPMQETSGDLTDVSGNSRTATKVGSGGVTYSTNGPAPGIKAIEFAGSSGVGYSAADDDVWSSTSLSVEAWVYPGSSFFGGQSARYLMTKHVSGVTNEWLILVEDVTGGSLKAQVNNAADTSYAGRTLSSWGPPSNEWHHIVMTYSSASTTLYVDAVSVGSAAGSGSRKGNSAGVLSIGHGPAVASRSWNGRMCFAAFYSTSLSATQVAAHYAAMKG